MEMNTQTTQLSLGPSNDAEVLPEEWEKAKEVGRQARQNLKFMRLSPAKKRVTIAMDVIKWLNAKKIGAAPGHFIGDLVTGDSDTVLDGGTCTACALGAMVVCHLENTAIAVPPVASSSAGFRGLRRLQSFASEARGPIKDTLGAYFDKVDLSLIEAAFERDLTWASRTYLPDGTPTVWNDSVYLNVHPMAEAAVKFGCRYDDATARMKAIMENIVANGGEFKP